MYDCKNDSKPDDCNNQDDSSRKWKVFSSHKFNSIQPPLCRFKTFHYAPQQLTANKYNGKLHGNVSRKQRLWSKQNITLKYDIHRENEHISKKQNINNTWAAEIWWKQTTISNKLQWISNEWTTKTTLNNIYQSDFSGLQILKVFGWFHWVSSYFWAKNLVSHNSSKRCFQFTFFGSMARRKHFYLFILTPRITKTHERYVALEAKHSQDNNLGKLVAALLFKTWVDRGIRYIQKDKKIMR